MTSFEFLKSLPTVPASLYEGKTVKEQNTLAVAMAKITGKEFKVPKVALDIDCDVVQYTTKGTGKEGMYLSIKSTTGYKGLFEKLCDGKELTPQARTEFKAMAYALADRLVDIADKL